MTRGFGSYLEQITYEGDGKPVWTINDKAFSKNAFIEVEEDRKAPSDSSYRGDLIHLLVDEFDEAEDAKHALEVL